MTAFASSFLDTTPAFNGPAVAMPDSVPPPEAAQSPTLSEPQTAAEMQAANLPPAETGDQIPAPAGQPESPPASNQGLILGMTAKQLLVIAAVAAATYLVIKKMSKKRR